MNILADLEPWCGNISESMGANILLLWQASLSLTWLSIYFSGIQCSLLHLQVSSQEMIGQSSLQLLLTLNSGPSFSFLRSVPSFSLHWFFASQGHPCHRGEEWNPFFLVMCQGLFKPLLRTISTSKRTPAREMFEWGFIGPIGHESERSIWWRSSPILRISHNSGHTV